MNGYQYHTKSVRETEAIIAALKACGWSGEQLYSARELHERFGWLVMYWQGSTRHWGFNPDAQDQYKTVAQEEVLGIIGKEPLLEFNLEPLKGEYATATINKEAKTVSVGCCEYSFDTIKALAAKINENL